MPNDIAHPIPSRDGMVLKLTHAICHISNVFYCTGVLFVTYSMLVSETTKKLKKYSRFNQIVEWCGGNFDGCIGTLKNFILYVVITFNNRIPLLVFDEGHFAKNLKEGNAHSSSKAALKVAELQMTLPLARVSLNEISIFKVCCSIMLNHVLSSR